MQRSLQVVLTTGIVFALASSLWAQTSSELPPHAKVLEGYEKVVSTADKKASLYTLWKRDKDSQLYAELPKTYAKQKYFIALTVASGERFAGLQAGDMYVYWRKYNNRLALLTPNLDIRSTGDKESKASVNRLFTDQILLELPIVTIGPGGGPVIDLDSMLINNAPVFFGASILNKKFATRIFELKKAKAFPENIEVAYELPTSSGRLQTLHYSISVIKENAAYKPRKADERIGYFTTAYSDLGQYQDDATRVRYINRWHLEKRDSKLKISPPKNPIVFYVEHTTPVRYRRWVKEGILYWNRAFEKIGIADAVVVQYQDAETGAHMEKDPEDVRYNFVRWLNNDVGTAIGPSRVNPNTGEILDADIILTDGWIRHYRYQFEDLLPKLAMEGFSPETLAWLKTRPDWDPRVLLAPPAQRDYIRARLLSQPIEPLGGHAVTKTDSRLLGDDEYDGLIGRASQVNGYCQAAEGMAFDMALMHMTLAMYNELRAVQEAEDKKEKEGEEKEEEKAEEKKPEEELIDGMPESFVGPLLAQLVAHEVGHTLGLRHNFKASSIYSLEQINSAEIKSNKPQAGSVMDYNPINIRYEAGKTQGDFGMIAVGPYDEWAIEYGYTFATDLKPILARVAEPELQYATDEDTGGPDPLARRYDFSKDPLDYAQEQVKLANFHRQRIIDHFVKEGDSWSKARRGYSITLSLQTRAVSMMANWVGGVHVYRDKKGDKDGRVPLEVVSADKQRAALKFVIEQTFRDDVYGLTPELLIHMSTDKWLDEGFSGMEDATWPVHDRIMGLQASTLTMLMNPSTLQRVYDNEFRTVADEDALTLPELLTALHDEIWSEMDLQCEQPTTARKPAISSLRRNLQREHLKRLIDLTMPGAGNSAAFKPISNLALVQLKAIQAEAKECQERNGDKLDPYSRAHLAEIQQVIEKALDAQFIYNAREIGGRSSRSILIFGQEQGSADSVE